MNVDIYVTDLAADILDILLPFNSHSIHNSAFETLIPENVMGAVGISLPGVAKPERHCTI